MTMVCDYICTSMTQQLHTYVRTITVVTFYSQIQRFKGYGNTLLQRKYYKFPKPSYISFFLGTDSDWMLSSVNRPSVLPKNFVRAKTKDVLCLVFFEKNVL